MLPRVHREYATVTIPSLKNQVRAVSSHQLPIKLSSYVAAQRPIFAHAPLDSTLARIVGPWRVGKVCASDDLAALKAQLGEALETAVPRKNFERLRNDLMGLDQVKQLGAALREEDWSAYPEYDFRA